MPIYVPKEIIPFTPTRSSPLIFLVGPIRGGADWQATMSYFLLEENPGVHIACPCRWDAEHSLSERFYQPFVQGPEFPRQRRWEEYYIEMAALSEEVPGCVLAYLPLRHPFRDAEEMEGHSYAKDSRRELGKFAGWLKFRKDTRLVVGGNPLFDGLDTILDDLNMAGDTIFTFHEDMRELARAALARAVA